MERDLYASGLTNEQLNFNSHAHVERDLHIVTPYHFLKTISTHTLTWSVTDWLKYENVIKDISTHTLTWSVTQSKFYDSKVAYDFNSHAHVERDVLGGVNIKGQTISTHTLTWSVTLDVVYIWCLLNVMRTYFFI